MLRPLYPEEDLGPAEERFTLFLVQYWGGPTTYSDAARPPAAADAARAVRGDAAAPRSTGCCTSAPGSTRPSLTPEQDAQFWDYVTHAAQFMVNTFEEPSCRSGLEHRLEPAPLRVA